MSRVEYERVDLPIVIRRAEDGGAIIRIGSGKDAHQHQIDADRLQEWLRPSSDFLFLRLDGIEGLVDDLRPGLQRLLASQPEAQSTAQLLVRCTLDVADLELAALPWEEAFARLVEVQWVSIVVVRTSPVRPRILATPFTLPLRILHVDPLPEVDIARMLPSVLRDRLEAADAVQVQAITRDESGRLSIPQWPTVEVLHLDRLPAFDDEKLRFSTAATETFGTLGWLDRFVNAMQTRLVILTSAGEAAQARRLGAALVARGGPAVLVYDYSDYYPFPYTFYTHVYQQLVHDFPLDAIVQSWPYWVRYQRYPSLFGGSGREEALRVSTLGLRLVQVAERLRHPTASQSIQDVGDMQALIAHRSTPGKASVIPLEQVQSELDEIRDQWDTYTFEFHEGEGLLPLTERLRRIREAAGVTGPTELPSDVPIITGPRYVNSSLWHEGENGMFAQLDQQTVRLTVGEIYHLGIQIGPRDELVRTAGAAGLIEEIFKWTPEMPGVWIEIGVTGIDFDVVGDPVQELWLPRQGPTDPIYFAVMPRVAGVARLRFCVYFRQNVLQSFRLAALTQEAGKPDARRKTRVKRLARALDLPEKTVGDLGYLPRLEYSITASADSFPDRPARAVSLVVNQLDGESRITVKGSGFFAVQTNCDSEQRVQSVRDALRDIAWERTELGPVDRFVRNGQPNVADSEGLKQALMQLAEVGWELFAEIIPHCERERLAEVLKPERQVITVAHVLLEHVIPWAVVYDQFYDAGAQDVAHDACLAALPRADNSLPVQQCGIHSECLLHPEQLRRRQADGQPPLSPETVACPLHFWGFKHIIETPVHQVPPGSKGHEQRDCILSNGQAQLVAGINTTFRTAQEHEARLKNLLTGATVAAAWTAVEYRRDRIMQCLQATELDLIYFYCHTRSNLDDPPVKTPCLEFSPNDAGQPGRITSGQLNYKTTWVHHPIVFLNGCSTVGLSPKALTPFVRTLVRDRGAAGIVGTEIPVSEGFASEMAIRFLDSFLKGCSAGDALLDTRRALLAKYIPLGLAYTLYAAAQLVLDIDGDGKCR